MGGFGFIIGIYASGVALLVVDESAFRVWIREDGLVEWLTFAALVTAFGYASLTAVAYKQRSSTRTACKMWTLIALLFLFGALEEISYGQRIFDIETPDFLLPDGSQGRDSLYNKQSETNLHNLVVYGVNINKLVFGKILALAVIAYFMVVPVLYRYNSRFRRFVNHCGLPIIQNYQLAVYLVVLLLTTALHSRNPRVNELLELMGCFTFLAMIVHPFNADALLNVKHLLIRKRTSMSPS
jgi:hypothetical protein